MVLELTRKTVPLKPLCAMGNWMLRMEGCLVRLAKGGHYFVFSIQFGGGFIRLSRKYGLSLGI
jgi:hypothetical protein